MDISKKTTVEGSQGNNGHQQENNGRGTQKEIMDTSKKTTVEELAKGIMDTGKKTTVEELARK